MSIPTAIPDDLAEAPPVSRWRSAATIVVPIVVAALVFAALHSLSRDLSYADIVTSLRNMPRQRILPAILATALSFAALAGYDRSALAYVGAKVKLRVVLLTSFIAYALGNTVGLGVLTGGAVRMRLYAAAGLDASQIGRVIAFNAASFGLGITVVGAAAVVWGAGAVARTLHVPEPLLRGIAIAILVATLGLLILCRDGRERTFFGMTLRLPAWRLAAGQLLISAVDIAATAAVLWFLLPPGTVHFAAFAAFFAIAITAGVISHVPGGLGVFEAIMLLALGGRTAGEAVAGALVAYRVIYYLLPLMVAVLLLAVLEVRRGVAAPAVRAAAALSPILLATFTLIIGIILLVSGVLPATDEAVDLLALHVPLPLVETSHFLGSVAGLALLFVARGMLHRLDAAWWAGMILAGISFVLALPKGIAISEMSLLAFLLATLALSRRQFDRRASLLTQGFSPQWFVAVGCIIAAVTWLLFFAYRDVSYGREMWWQFEFDAHAPRALRATLAVVLIALVLAIRHVLRPPTGRLPAADDAEINRAAQIVRNQDYAESCLSLMGDKHLLFSPSGKSFVMFGKQGRSWVSLYDPVGDRSEWPDLVWRFIELAETHGGRAAFYQVRPQNLPIYLDAGLRAFKLGEYAHVPLTDFSLKGSRRANLRQGVSRAEREGLTFEVVDSANVAPLLPELKTVSDRWLEEHEAREKAFSLGAFDEDYLGRLPIAVVRKGTVVVAFATLMCTDAKVEASVDLMRHVPDAPPGTMDFLFARIMLHFQAQGFLRFGLGMAPMSGMAEHRLAPRWHRFGRLLFEHGERFYNFRGLRSFKDKFGPVWEARYLAAPGGAAPIFALTDTAALIGGGLKGAIGK